jgi:predicted permease
MYIAMIFALLALWPASILAMRPGDRERLRQESIVVFYHGFDNYMKLAFPEDEVRPLCSTPMANEAIHYFCRALLTDQRIGL